MAGCAAGRRRGLVRRREIVMSVPRRGWTVTVFNRGRTSVQPAGVPVIRGDREDHATLVRLAGHGPWHVAVDVAGSVPAVWGTWPGRWPRSLRGTCDVHGLVYRDWPHVPVDESSPSRPGDPDDDPALDGGTLTATGR